MFDWLTNLFDILLSVVPRMKKVPPTHRMIKWSHCKEGTLHGPGLIWHWPLVTEEQVVDMRWESTINYVQAVTMADGTSVSARGKIVWRLSDPLTAVEDNHEFWDRVPEQMLSATVCVLGACHKSDLRNTVSMNMMLTIECRERIEPIGVEVKECAFTELVVSPAFRLINDNGE